MTAEIAHWTDRAACAGMDTNLWFPEQGASTREALAVCSTCEVRAECLAFGMGERFGLYGGKTARERRTLRNGQIRRQRTVTHGTPAGWTWHRTRHEKPCWACDDAHSRELETATRLRKEGR